MPIDAIVTDLDDTLLNDASLLSPYTLDVFARAKAMGVRVIPASGRAQFSMERFVRQLDTGLPYIASNGAQLVNADHTELSTATLAPETARALIRYLRANGFYVQCYRGDHFYYDAECDVSRSYRASSGMNGQAVGDLETFVDFPTPKLLSVHDPEQVSHLYPLIQHAFPQVSFTISKPYFLEAQPENVSKGTALATLATLLHLHPERTLVFGDSLNDLAMMRFAVHSVAMGNAREEVRREARHVCGTNAEDGVARFVQTHVLDAVALP